MDYFYDGWMHFFGLQNLSYIHSHYKAWKIHDIFGWTNPLRKRNLDITSNGSLIFIIIQYILTQYYNAKLQL